MSIRQRLGFLTLLAVGVTSILTGTVGGSRLESASERDLSSLLGTWTYRSFHNDPNPNLSSQSLVSGVWTLKIDGFTGDSFSGTMSSGGVTMDVSGSAKSDDPVKVEFTASTTVTGEVWGYDGAGYIVPEWDSANNQPLSMVGSIVGASKSARKDRGYVSHWIAIKQIEPTPQVLDGIRFQVSDTMGEKLSLANGSPTLVVFSQGFSCAHCSEQISALLKLEPSLKEKSVSTVVLVADSNESLKKSLGSTTTEMQFAADPRQTEFAKFGCAGTIPRHGIFLFDQNQKCEWQQTGIQPFMNFDALLKKINNQ